MQPGAEDADRAAIPVERRVVDELKIQRGVGLRADLKIAVRFDRVGQ